MGIQLEVETTQLANAGSKFEGLASQYEAAYRALTSAVESMRGVSWKGTDAESFVAKVSEFQDDFQKMVNLLKGLGSDMKKSAQEYEARQSAAVSGANRLKGSI